MSQDTTAGRLLVAGPQAAVEGLIGAMAGPWELVRAHTVSEAMWRLRRESAVDAVVIVPGGELSEYIELCRHIKLGRRSSFVSVVFVLGEGEHADRRIELYNAGADDCIQLPASPEELTIRLLHAVRTTQATTSLEDATAVITALANAIEGKDSYTCGHVERVAAYAVDIGRRLGLDTGQLTALHTGALVHDIGKVVVPDQILNKPGKLSDAEMAIMMRHPVVGYEVLQPLRTFREVLPIVRWHHERPNGRGYPDGLDDDHLPLLPRIVSVADCFDALSTDRPYRRAMSMKECREILSRCAEEGDLTPHLVDLLLDIVDDGSGLTLDALASRA